MSMKSFQLSIVHKGKHVQGEVIPLHDAGIGGIPLSYKVVIDGKNHGVVRCGPNKWLSTDIADESLVAAIGNYIHLWQE
jgi:hypothetical protein